MDLEGDRAGAAAIEGAADSESCPWHVRLIPGLMILAEPSIWKVFFEAELEGRIHQGAPPCLRVQGKEGGAKQRARHEGGQVLRQVRVDVPSGQRAARHVVRWRQVLHHDEAQLRVKVVHFRHVLRAQPGLLPQSVCLKTRPFLQGSPILSDILYA